MNAHLKQAAAGLVATAGFVFIGRQDGLALPTSQPAAATGADAQARFQQVWRVSIQQRVGYWMADGKPIPLMPRKRMKWQVQTADVEMTAPMPVAPDVARQSSQLPVKTPAPRPGAHTQVRFCCSRNVSGGFFPAGNRTRRPKRTVRLRVLLATPTFAMPR